MEHALQLVLQIVVWIAMKLIAHPRICCPYFLIGMKYCSPFPPLLLCWLSLTYFLWFFFHDFHSIPFVSFLFGLIFSSSFFTFSISYKEWRLAHMKDFINMTTGFMEELELPESKPRVETYETFFQQGGDTAPMS